MNLINRIFKEPDDVIYKHATEYEKFAIRQAIDNWNVEQPIVNIS